MSAKSGRHVLHDWRPEYPTFWAERGKRIAARVAPMPFVPHRYHRRKS